ncbi:MAG: glycosyltransferase family 4 protein [bacterium]
MRIAFFSWESLHSIAIGGIAVHVTEIACALQRKGHEVHVFTRMGRSNHSQYENIHGVHYHRCPYAHHPDFIEEVNNMCRSMVHSFFQTEDYIGHFDIVHCHDWLTTNVLVWIKKGRPRKSVITIHSTEFGRCGNKFNKGRSDIIRHLEWYGTYEASKVICVSNFLKEEVKRIYSVPEDKINVIYNGINYRDFDGWIDPGAVKRMYGIGPMDPMVLFVGRIVYQKGTDLLIEAIPSILKFHGNAKFIFVGDGEMRHQVESRAHHLGVAHATRFLGHANGYKLIDLYKACDCVCIPSRNEPFGIVLLEAWSAGKPAVASVNGGPGEIIWHDVNGLKINDNVDSVAWGIGTLFSDFEHARWMGRNGRIAVETAFSWDVIADVTLSVYEN